MTTQTATTTTADNERGKHLYMTISTIDMNGKQVGFRLVDLYHYGTQAWLAKHHWWAMHEGHLVETCRATQIEVEEFLALEAKKLQDKFAA